MKNNYHQEKLPVEHDFWTIFKIYGNRLYHFLSFNSLLLVTCVLAVNLVTPLSIDLVSTKPIFDFSTPFINGLRVFGTDKCTYFEEELTIDKDSQLLHKTRPLENTAFIPGELKPGAIPEFKIASIDNSMNIEERQLTLLDIDTSDYSIIDCNDVLYNNMLETKIAMEFNCSQNIDALIKDIGFKIEAYEGSPPEHVVYQINIKESYNCIVRNLPHLRVKTLANDTNSMDSLFIELKRLSDIAASYIELEKRESKLADIESAKYGW